MTRINVLLASAEHHNCVHLNQLTQIDTGDRGRYPVFPLAYPQPHSAFELQSMVTDLFATGLPGELICVCT